jgi:PAS domain-containing protein
MSDPFQVLSPTEIESTLDHLSDAVVVFDREWRIAYLNQTAKAIVGRNMPVTAGSMAERPVEELIGRHAWTTFPGLAASPIRGAYEEAVRSGEPRHLVEHFDQVDRWYEARAIPQGDKLVVIYRDVTDQQRVENDMREFIDGIAEAERIVRFGVWRWDVGSGRVRWSDELHHISACSPANSRAPSRPSSSRSSPRTGGGSGRRSPPRWRARSRSPSRSGSCAPTAGSERCSRRGG